VAAVIKKNIKIWEGKNGPLLIAEIGGNHEGNFTYAKKLLKLAIESNVDIVKFQIYRGSNLVNRKISPDRYFHFKKFELSKKQHLYLADQCKESSVKYLASVWNLEDLKWINAKLDYFKVGSGDLTAFELLDGICKYKKPIILSTGLSSLLEIKKTLNFIKSRNSFYKNKKNISLLQCTSCYPTNSNEVNLNVIKNLKKLGYVTGYSHHHKDLYPLEIAYTYGAKIFEFHFTDTRLNKNFRDHKISLTHKDVLNFIKKIKTINLLSGNYKKNPTTNEVLSNNISTFRRGIYLKKRIKKNQTIKIDNLISLRPFVKGGISADKYFSLIDKKAKKDLESLELLKKSDLL
jgi:N-acetylneuraminate synthase/N,N'-diacetyllegionaminate synthase